MAEVTDLLYPQDRPLVVGEDDGSAPRLVRAQGYGEGWRKNQVGWVVGTRVDALIAHRLLAPVATGEPVSGTTPLDAPGTLRPGETVPELGIHHRIGTDARDDALTEAQSHVQTFPPAEPAEATYDLDATPTTKARPRPRAAK